MIFGIFLLLCAMICVNPMISHNGATVLFFMNGKAVTLEAAIYRFVVIVHDALGWMSE